MAYEPHICVYHADCPDGGAAAWAIKRRWPVVDLIPGKYEEDLDFGERVLTDQNIIFVDFSKPAALLRELLDEGGAKSVLVLDHHKSAEASLADVPRFSGPIDPTPYTMGAWFDMEKSGCRLAWEFAFPSEPLPYSLALIEDRDLWKFEHGENTRNFAACLRTCDFDDMATFDWAMVSVDAMCEEGKHLRPAEERLVQKFLKEQYVIEMTQAYHAAFGEENSPYHIGEGRYFTIPTVNVPYHYASEACAELMKQHPTAPCVSAWTRLANGDVKVSLRSAKGTGLDVSRLAGPFGGGGHFNAAGFSVHATTF